MYPEKRMPKKKTLVKNAEAGSCSRFSAHVESFCAEIRDLMQSFQGTKKFGSTELSSFSTYTIPIMHLFHPKKLA